MSTTAGSQPMTLHRSWRSTLETWAVQAADVADHAAAGEVAAVVKPRPGQCVEEGVTGYAQI